FSLGPRDQRGPPAPARLAAAHPPGSAAALRGAPASPAVPVVRRGDLLQRRRDDRRVAPRPRLADRAPGARRLPVRDPGALLVDRGGADRASHLAADL